MATLSLRPWAVLLAIPAFTLPRPAESQALVPVATEFRVSTVTTAPQIEPHIAMSADGDFVVVWRGGYGSESNVFGQRFTGNIKNDGSRFRVNAYSTGSQYGASVAMAPSGSFLVVWMGDDLQPFTKDIYARYFSREGVPETEFRLNTFTSGFQQNPHVAWGGSGPGPNGFLAVWSSQDQASGTSGADVYGRRISATGDLIGGEFRVSDVIPLSQIPTDVTGNAHGFVVVYTADEVQGSGKGVFAKRFNASAVPVGNEMLVNSITTGDQDHGHAALASTGELLVIFEVGVTNTDVVARSFDALSAPLGDEFRVNTVTTNHQRPYAVAVDAADQFLMVWDSLVVGGLPADYDIFSKTATKLGVMAPDTRLNTAHVAVAQMHPAVAAGPAGFFVAAWDDDTYGPQEIFATYLGPSGDANGDGVVSVVDVLYLINYLFAGGPEPKGPSDPNHSFATDVSDILFLINFLFAAGPQPF